VTLSAANTFFPEATAVALFGKPATQANLGLGFGRLSHDMSSQSSSQARIIVFDGGGQLTGCCVMTPPSGIASMGCCCCGTSVDGMLDDFGFATNQGNEWVSCFFRQRGVGV